MSDTLNMMTLIALGILVSYFYSVAATLFWGGDVFFEAAAMLTTFSLAGDLTALAQPVNGIEEIEELQHTLKSLADQVTRDQDRQPAGRQRTSS